MSNETILTQTDREREEVAKHVRSVFESFGENTTVEEMRAGWESLFAGTVYEVGASARKIETPNFRGEWIVAPGAAEDRAIVYLHGGGYVIGSVNSYRDMCERLSRAANAAVLAVDYRLAPEHPFPAAVDDATSAYRWILDQGIDPRRIAVAGDSAGGALTLAVLFSARDAGLPLPACGVPISPWVDLEHTGKAMITMDALEPMCRKQVLESCVQLYMPGLDIRNPMASSIHGDFTGLPPLFVPIGGHETLLDDADRIIALADEAGVPATLKVYDKQFHVFQIFASRMAEAQAAIDDIGEFILKHTA